MSNYANNTRLNDAALLSKDTVRSVDPSDTLVCFVITGFRNLFKKKKGAFLRTPTTEVLINV